MSRAVRMALLLFCVLFFLIGCRRKQESESPPLPEALQDYRGREPRLKVYQHETGQVAEMNFEDYISGVVAAEMDPEWPESALGAQAIIARSFTLQKIKENGGLPHRNAHASTDFKEFQAYSADRITERVRKAVESTRGRVALYDGDYIRAWFHAYAGPRTALADEGLEYKGGNPPYIQSVSSPGEKIIPEAEGNWNASFPLMEVQARVAEITGTDPGAITAIEISATGPSGRATRINFNGVEAPAASLRLALGSTVMRSTMLDSLEISADKLIMSGTGYGHGVGMCQWGARALAEEGWSGDKIVCYFFKGVERVKLWD